MKTNPQTLVLLTPAFPESAEDVWLPWQGEFLRNLNRNYPQLRVIVIAFRLPRGPERTFSFEGNLVHTAGCTGNGRLRSLLLWRRVWKQLQAIRRSSGTIGLLSLFCSESAYVGQQFAKRYRLPHMIWILGQDARPANGMVRRIRPAPEQLIALSDFVRRSFAESHGIRPARLIPIGIDPAAFPPSAVKDIDLIAVGSLSGIKRQHLFVDVVAAIARRRSVRAVICGGGTEEHALAERIRQEGLRTQIRMTGMIPPWEARALMQRSRILLHTSAYEGFGLVCTEALFAGARVVSLTRPMDAEIPGWHHADDTAAMTAIALRLLESQDEAAPVLPFHMDNTTREILRCFPFILDARPEA